MEVAAMIAFAGLLVFSAHLFAGVFKRTAIPDVLMLIFIGFLSGFLWSILLNKFRTIQNSIFTTPAFVFVVFGIAESMGYSGYIAALAFGITLGNIELLHIPMIQQYIPHDPIALDTTERLFFSEIVFLLKTFFFVYIGISIKLTDLWLISLGLILAFSILIVRIPAVRLSMKRSIPIKDASFIAVMVPKGLAAAVLACIPLQEGIAKGELIQHVTYAVVMFSIILTSLFVFLVDKTMLAKLYAWIFSCFGKCPPDAVEPESIQVTGQLFE